MLGRLALLLYGPAGLLCQSQTPWYQGIDSITILSPDTNGAQDIVNGIWQQMEEDAHGNSSAFQKGQFGNKRRAILLKQGNYTGLTIPVNWYTTVMGVGITPKDVVVQGISSIDAYPGSQKGSLENFWKSVEGVTTLERDTLWSVSQAAPLRRSVISGNLWLSESAEHSTNDGAHYTSGGFLADVTVEGELQWGTQQQFFFRNSDLKVNYAGGGQSYVFVGVNGAPTYDQSKPKPLVSTVDRAPVIAEKPYLVEFSGQWYISVPPITHQRSGTSAGEQVTLMPMSEVFVAKEGDTADAINAGIKGKKALLLTPAIYGLDSPIFIDEPSFVVLGIGMPTLVSTKGLSALVVAPNAYGARVAGVLVEAGKTVGPDATAPLVFWRGADGIASDIFVRVGAFSYETPFHQSCVPTQADVMVRVDGDRVVIDNAWIWHADHDDCTDVSNPDDPAPPASDECYTRTGLVVNGKDVTTYGLAVEHTKHDLVEWEGENGQVFFFQSELPYRSNLDFGKDGYVGYRVGYGVQKHTGHGVGVYQVFNTYSMTTSMRLPATAEMTNAFTWCITGNRSGLGNLACLSPGTDNCISGDCDYNSCQTFNFSSLLPSTTKQPMQSLLLV